MYTRASEVDSFTFPVKILYTLLFFLIHATWPAHLILPDFDHPNDTSQGLHTITLLIILFCPVSCYLFPFRPTYLPQDPTLKHPQHT